MNHISFGSVLKDARIKKGYELTTVARRLRIRPDILQAIENSDFVNMPPSGYTRNMINAYARMLNLDSNEITRMYLDEVYAYRVGRAYKDMKQSRYQNRNTSNATTRPGSSKITEDTSSWSRNEVSTDKNGINSFGRRVYSSREDLPKYDRAPQTPVRGQQLHQSRRPVITEGKYGNLVSSAPSNYVKRSKTPFIIGGIALVIIVLIVFFVSSCSAANSEQQNIPVTGVESKSEAETQDQTPKETAPTSFEFTYEIAAGNSAWIEVYVDDEQKEAGEVTGVHTATYTSTKTVEFIAGSPEGITITINGEKQTVSANENGVVSITYDFNDILDAWYNAHPDVKKPTSSTTNTATAGSSTSTQSSNSTTSSNTSSQTNTTSSSTLSQTSSSTT